MSEPKRLLCIVGSMNAGGAETFLMKIYRKLDKEKYQMDFAVATMDKAFYDDEIYNLGGKIFHIKPKSEGIISNFNSIKKIVRENEYRYVLRTSQHSLSALELFAAKLGGAKITTFRSSNSNTTSDSKKEKILHKICMFMPYLFANVRIAPSTEAAEFMFGKNCIKKNRAFLLNNAIDTNIFCFNEKDRIEYRKKFGINQGILVGHVGRFNNQKNHKFLIEIFNDLLKKNNDAKLILVGTGELEKEIKRKVFELGIEGHVIFTGVRNDVSRILSAVDIFVFPSFYEGMPNTVIEAQAVGTKCLISDSISREAEITELVHFESLNKGSNEWSEDILHFVSSESEPREKYNEYMVKRGYSIETSVNKFVDLVYEDIRE